MRRKGQVFSMPAKVSIGQDRNKKDPQRGRKLTNLLHHHFLIHNRHKEDPHRGRKHIRQTFQINEHNYRNKKDPHRGRTDKVFVNVKGINHRNKKDPQRGRKLPRQKMFTGISSINRNKKAPQRGRKLNQYQSNRSFYPNHDRNKKAPQRGRSFFSCVLLNL